MLPTHFLLAFPPALSSRAGFAFEAVRGVGLAAKKHDGVRILGRGELNIALKVEVAHVTAGAKKKIEEAGGSVSE